MTDFLSDDARLDPRDTPADAEMPASRLDRRSFLRALSGSALTLVAGGLTVTLAACQGAGGGGSPTTVNVPFSGVGAQTPPSPVSSSFGISSGSSTGPGGSGPSSSSNSSASSGSGSSGSGSGSSGSGSSGSSSSSSSVTGALRRAAAGVNGWSTRV